MITRFSNSTNYNINHRYIWQLKKASLTHKKCRFSSKRLLAPLVDAANDAATADLAAFLQPIA